MISYREALARVLEGAAPLPARALPLAEALGLVAADDVTAREALPPFTNAGMDGFAVRAADVAAAGDATPVRLRVTEDLPAGRLPEHAVAAGTASRIMTGAPVPAGADAVVPVESTETVGDTVLVRRPVPAGANVRPAGEDLVPGARVLARGDVLRPAEIGLLAVAGHAAVAVHPRPRLAIVTTGDELVAVGEEPAPGHIRDANVHLLRAQALAVGAQPVTFERVPDRRDAVMDVLQRAATAADVVVTTGGISMGVYDCVKDALEALGAECRFWRVAQKPGKPLGLWRLHGCPVLGLPGNPVSAAVVMEEYVRPLLRRLLGHARLFRPEVEAALDSAWSRREGDDRLHLLRVHVRLEDGRRRARVSGPQGSGIVSSLAHANALAFLPPEVAVVPAGGAVTVHLTEEPEDH